MVGSPQDGECERAVNQASRNRIGGYDDYEDEQDGRKGGADQNHRWEATAASAMAGQVNEDGSYPINRYGNLCVSDSYVAASTSTAAA